LPPYNKYLSRVLFFEKELTEREQISLLMRGWSDRQRSYKEMGLLFNETFRRGQIGISKFTMERIIKCFEQTGSKNRAKPVTATSSE